MVLLRVPIRIEIATNVAPFGRAGIFAPNKDHPPLECKPDLRRCEWSIRNRLTAPSPKRELSPPMGVTIENCLL